MTSIALKRQKVDPAKAALSRAHEEGLRMNRSCWSCGVGGCAEFRCVAGHSFFACDETCGHPRVDRYGAVDWDDCHECQSEMKAQEERLERARPDADADDGRGRFP